MRTKTLLLTAALTAAGVAASMAQVYSVNVVGYVNVTVPAGKLMLLANPLNNADNKLATVMPLPDTADGSTVFRFNAQTQQYQEAVSFVGGFGWFGTAVDQITLAPGEGFFFLAGTADVNLTFVGEVPTGTLTVPLAAGPYLSLVGSMVPQENRVGDVATAATTMGFPAADSDTIFSWDGTAQNYVTASYVDGFGWVEADANVAGPNIPVGNGFWVLKAAGNLAVNWVRTFTVGP
jgi:hypothetical protein